MLRKNCFLVLIFSFLVGCITQRISAPTLSNSTISGLVVFSSYITTNPHVEQIFVKNLDTGNIKQLTFVESNSMPRWSPDGSKIIFTRTFLDRSRNLFIMEKDGSNQELLVSISELENFPAWSPNGERVSFDAYDGDKSDIHLIDLKTQFTFKLTNSLEYSSSPAWSSSGDKIAFQGSVGLGRPQIFVVDIDDRNLVQITDYKVENFDGSPVWCPDDSCIVFFRNQGGYDKLILINLRSKEEISLLDGLFDANLLIRDITQSTSRKYITFKVGDEHYAMNFDTKEIFSLKTNATSLSLYP